MLPTPSPRDRDRVPGRFGALGRVSSALAVAVMAAVVIGPAAGIASAQAQAPGLDRFARPPETPAELWSAINYLTRVGRADDAVPLIDRFLDSEPDDNTLLELRERFGVGSILRLEDDPRTAERVGEILNLFNAASRRNAQREDRIRRYVGLLTGSPLQQSEALIRLGESGPYSVPILFEAIRAADDSDRALLVGNMGRLQRRAVPPLIAALESPDASLAADVASALGRIGDRRALPFLIAEAASTDDDRAAVRSEASAAVLRMTGAPLDKLPKAPAQLVLDEALRYLTGVYEFPGPQVSLWSWNDETVAPEVVSPSEAEARLGLRFAEHAAALLPDDRRAGSVLTAFRVKQLLRDAEVTDAVSEPLPDSLLDELVGLGPEALADSLGLLLDAKQFAAAPAIITALGLVSDPDSLSTLPPSPIVRALSAPDRLVQLAAARAIVAIDPPRPFPGSSRVVPILSRSLDPLMQPQIVVVSGNAPMRTALASSVLDRGFEPVMASTADEGFRRAAESAGVEALIIDPAFLQGRRDARDLLIDLRNDSRTAALPVLLPVPIDPARAIARAEEFEFRQAEREPNPIAAQSSPVAFAGRPRRARIDGRLSPDDRRPFGRPATVWPPKVPEELEERDPDSIEMPAAPPPPPTPDISGDLFALGSLRSGDLISAFVEPSPGSTLRPEDALIWIERREGARGVPIARGRGSLSFQVDSPGLYDLRVQAAEQFLYGYRALYTLHITLYDYDTIIPPITGSVRLKVEELARQFDRVSLLSAPGDPMAVESALFSAWDEAGSRPATPRQRAGYALAAANAIARVADRPDGPFAADLALAVPTLHRLMTDPILSASASKALGVVPTVESQRDLAEMAFDTTRPLPARIASAEALRDSVRRFGPLLAPDQRTRLLRARDRAREPELRQAFENVISTLRSIGLPAVDTAPPEAPNTD